MDFQSSTFCLNDPLVPIPILDYVDVVVHLFLRETREFYNLERLWADAPMVELPEALIEATPTEYDEDYAEFDEFDGYNL